MGNQGFGVYEGFWMCGYKGPLFDIKTVNSIELQKL